MSKRIFFASASPRRKELVSGIFGERIKFVKHDFDENSIKIASSGAGLKKLALMKALSVCKKHKASLIIASDTAVSCGGKILGKPAGKKDAEKMLRRLSGKKVIVMTSVALVDSANGRKSVFLEKTRVKIKNLSASEIQGYVKTGEPLDKAGAFAVQGRGAFLVEGIEGDYYNVVGLPLCRLCSALEKFGVRLF